MEKDADAIVNIMMLLFFFLPSSLRPNTASNFFTYLLLPTLLLPPNQPPIFLRPCLRRCHPKLQWASSRLHHSESLDEMIEPGIMKTIPLRFSRFVFSDKIMEGDEGLRIMECLRGRLLVERAASKAANDESEQIGKKEGNVNVFRVELNNLLEKKYAFKLMVKTFGSGRNSRFNNISKMKNDSHIIYELEKLEKKMNDEHSVESDSQNCMFSEEHSQGII
ncbi:hypothetical protein L1887_00717 [Cichorium endivia]|nr:hypothetical protein L1887_00717 [Cichorium endivia]